jgi:hypothetical protein
VKLAAVTRGAAWYGSARRGSARHGAARHGEARQGKARIEAHDGRTGGSIPPGGPAH